MNRGLAALLSGMNDDTDDKPAILPEAAIMQLREAAALYTVSVPFKVGDLVTPRRNSYLKAAGEPEVVIEVDGAAAPSFIGEPGMPAFGQRYNMRVLSLKGGEVFPYWVEAACYEAYTGPID